MTSDESLILRLTRENQSLRLAADCRDEDRKRMTAAIDSLDDPACPPDESITFEGFTLADRLDLLVARLQQFPLKLTETTHTLPGQVFHVTIPTSIDDIEHYVIAPSKERVEEWLKTEHRHGFSPGYEPQIERVTPVLGDTYWLR